VDLSGQPALQNTASNVFFRIYSYGGGAYTVSGLGPTVVVTGSVAPKTVMLNVTPRAGQIELSWQAGAGLTNVQYIGVLDGTTLWADLGLAPQLQSSTWNLFLSTTGAARFFRLGP
jgi:hypothetical protein